MYGQYEYKSGQIKHKGRFNIYQGRDGGVYLLMGSRWTKLSHNQVCDLCIDVYSLVDFDYVAYGKHYQMSPNLI